MYHIVLEEKIAHLTLCVTVWWWDDKKRGMMLIIFGDLCKC